MKKAKIRILGICIVLLAILYGVILGSEDATPAVVLFLIGLLAIFGKQEDNYDR